MRNTNVVTIGRTVLFQSSKDKQKCLDDIIILKEEIELLKQEQIALTISTNQLSNTAKEINNSIVIEKNKLVKNINELTFKFKELEEEYDYLKKSKILLLEEMEELNKNKVLIKTDINNIDTQHKAKEIAYKNEIDKYELLIEQLKIKQNITQNKLNELNLEIKALKTINSKISNDTDLLKADRAITSKKLKEDFDAATKALEAIYSDIADKKTKVSKIEKDIKSLDKKKLLLVKELSDLDSLKLSKETCFSQLDNRDAAITKRESWVKEYNIKLKKYIQQLERKLNIIIPEF